MNKVFFVTMGVWSCGAVARADAPVADAPVVAPLMVPEAAADASALWAGLAGGKLTAAQAWQSGLLDADTVQTGLAQGVASGQSENAMRLRRELGALLVNNAPAVAAAGAQLPRGVQLALADYYASVSDERAAPLYEAVIAQTPPSYEQGLRLLALGKFWSQQKQAPRAQEAFGRGRAMLLAGGKNAHFATEMLLETARAWERSGDADKAQSFYAQVAQEGDALFQALAIYDRANRLFKAGEQQQARALLAPAIGGKSTSEVQVGLLSLLSASYLKSGEVERAQSTARQALELYGGLKSPPPPQLGLEPQVERARKVLEQSQHDKDSDVKPAENATTPVASAGNAPKSDGARATTAK